MPSRSQSRNNHALSSGDIRNSRQSSKSKAGHRGEELVRHMSSLPGFLQREEKPQDKILNFGVLDWERLENWKQKQKPRSVQSRSGTSHVGSSSSSSTKVPSIASDTVKPLSEFLLPHSSLVTDNRKTRKDSEKSSHKIKGHRSKQKQSLDMEMPKKSEPKQDSVILLLPKDFSGSGPDESQETFFSRNSTELNWSSFSDVFSIEELHFEEPTSDVPHSCPLPSINTETELDINLERLIHNQRMDHDLLPSPEENKKREMSNSTNRLSFSIGRLSRSLSSKEHSSLPKLKHTSVRSGPAEASNFQHGNTTCRSRISPFRRFLDPIRKNRASKPINLEEIHTDKSSSKFNTALLQLTVKSGLPLFKFLVETNNEILASTVKQLSTFEKDDPSWLYTFYSVHEVKKKSASWIYQGSKPKPPDFSYNVIGQMNVSKPVESVLYGVDLSKLDKSVNSELGAVVIEKGIVVILPGAVHSLPSEGEPASLIERWRTGGLCDCGGWDVGCKLQILTNPDQDLCLFLQEPGKQSEPVFRVVDRGEGIYSVEYESCMSSLQAFAVSVAVLSDQKQTENSYREERKGHYRSKSSIVQGEGTRYATYPPHSPVGRA